MELINIAKHITLVHRRDEYRAVPASVDKMRKLVADGKMDLIEKAKATAIDGVDGLINSITIQPKEGELFDVPADHVLVFFGLAPKLGPDCRMGPQHQSQNDQCRY